MLNPLDFSVGNRPFLRDVRDRLGALRFEHFEVQPQSASIGAEIRGIDLRGELDDDVMKELETALVEFKVIFFRDQGVDVEQQSRFAARFGELEVHPFLPANTENDHVIRFEKGEAVVGYENVWHSDVSWRELPSLGSVLHAIDVPSIGGDTVWADMEAAYEGLPDEVKEQIDDAVAVHDFANSFGRGLDAKQLEERRKEFPPARHPVVRTHPASGRRCIYVNAVFTSHIEGLSEQQSDELLARLCTQAQTPEYQCRFRWSKGSLAFWDNRSTQHYAVNDYWPQNRTMERVTIIGGPPA
jgi:alpha-ketoglutarate-dependent taurine dioxygenase